VGLGNGFNSLFPSATGTTDSQLHYSLATEVGGRMSEGVVITVRINPNSYKNSCIRP
jgi:hypothetical protein